MKSNNHITRIFFNSLKSIDSKNVIELFNYIKSNDVNNSINLKSVISGLEKECFGFYLIEEKTDDLIFNIFYITNQPILNGYALTLTLRQDNRDYILGLFAKYLCDKFSDLTVTTVFNTFQQNNRKLFEEYNYYTITNYDIEKAKCDLELKGRKNPTLFKSPFKNIIYTPIIEESWLENKKKGITNSSAVNYIYIMRHQINGRFKIGRSNNPSYREKTLQSQEPEVELLFKWVAPKYIEKELHKEFKQKKVRGEWFELSDEDIVKINNIMNSYQIDKL